jgi:predicted RNA-binding protein with PUA-like domain
MAHWLVKSEPDVYSIDKLEKEGQTVWDGVRNYAARLHLRGMKKGDEVFFYHSMDGELAIVGIAKVLKEAYPDPSAKEGDWSAVDLKFHKKLKTPVKLSQIKKEKKLASMALVRISRLSVQPVTDEEWMKVMEMAGEQKNR